MKNRLLPLGLLFFLLFFNVCQTPRSGRQVIWKSDQYALYRDSLVQAPFVARALSATELESNYQSLSPAAPTRWKMSRPNQAFPRYQSDYPLVDALFNLALEEMEQAVAADSTFRTGRQGDVPYSILLSTAALQPRVSGYSLLRQVKNGRILQQAGTGGAYPVSSDRMVWALAAWELYQVTGDRNWLGEVYPIIRNALEEDLKHVFNPQSGLFRGASSFGEVGERRYPAWMQPADLYESESLEVNALFYQAHEVLSAMATLLNDMPAASKYHQLAVSVKKRINDQLWLPDKGYYGQYRYGRNFKLLSPRSEALGEALAILLGVTDIGRTEAVVERTPVTALGIPAIYPPVPPVSPASPRQSRPLVQAYWSLAAAKAGNELALMESMGAFYRSAALLLTDQESPGARHSGEAGMQGVAGQQLGLLAGNLSLVLKVIFGLDFQPQSLVFKPVVPRAFQGRRQLSNFRYRQSILDIEMTGYGNRIRSFRLDGEKLAVAAVPAIMKGRHSVKIELANEELKTDKGPEKIHKVAVVLPPGMPVVTYTAGTLAWNPVAGAVAYRVLKNGRHLLRTVRNTAPVPVHEQEYAEYQVIAVDALGHESFASEPVLLVSEAARQLYELEGLATLASLPYPGFSGKGFVVSSRRQNSRLRLPVSVPQTGLYAIDFRYAHGGGPAGTDAACVMRSLRNGPAFIGTIVLPRPGNQAAADWGFTNAVQVKLKKGSHTLWLAVELPQENRPGETDEVLLDYMRLTQIETEAEPGSGVR